MISLNNAIHEKDIDISVQGGVVTLQGQVDSDAAREEAESATREVLGNLV